MVSRGAGVHLVAAVWPFYFQKNFILRVVRWVWEWCPVLGVSTGGVFGRLFGDGVSGPFIGCWGWTWFMIYVYIIWLPLALATVRVGPWESAIELLGPQALRGVGRRKG